MEIDRILRSINISEEDLRKAALALPEREILELGEEIERFKQLMQKKLKLQSEYAKINYLIYETYMSVHQNAIVISALYSESRIKMGQLDPGIVDKIEYILDKYLFLGESNEGQEFRI